MTLNLLLYINLVTSVYGIALAMTLAAIDIVCHFERTHIFLEFYSLHKYLGLCVGNLVFAVPNPLSAVAHETPLHFSLSFSAYT